MSGIRTLTHEEFAAIRAKGTAFTHDFIQERVKQIAAAKLIEKKAGLLRDTAAAKKIEEKIQNGDIAWMTTLLKKLDTAIIWQQETEESILKKARHYYTEKEFSDLKAVGDPFDRLPFMRAHMESLHLTTRQRRRLDQHDTTQAPIDLKLRRVLRQNCKQGTALLNMHLGLIGENGHHHATPYELEMRNKQKKRWQEFGKKTILVRGDEEISMLDVMKSAGAKKLAETLTLTKGLENYAKATGLTWTFITLTAPSRMHPNPANGKSSWDGTTPDRAHEWIADAAGRVVKRLLKKGIIISGLRVVESHKDGCPHWHLLVFAPLDQMSLIEAEYRWQPEWKSEPGMKFVLNDGTASAVSYVFKYITQTINQVEMIEGEAGFVDAWRSTWGIRAFAFFGTPPVSLWRDFRAVKECPAEPLVAEMWHAAHQGDAHAFIKLNGGLNVARKDRPVISKTTSNKHDKTKTIEFILQDTAESIRFDFVKWQQTRKEPQSHASARVEVILNYPRKAFHSTPPTPAPPRGLVLGIMPRPFGGIHCHAPKPPSLGSGEKQPRHSTGALVGALPVRARDDRAHPGKITFERSGGIAKPLSERPWRAYRRSARRGAMEGGRGEGIRFSHPKGGVCS